MDIWKLAAGVLEVELVSAEPEMALSVINEAGIEIFQLRRTGDLVCCFQIQRRNYPQLAALCEKRGESLKILHRLGLFWLGSATLRRPVLLTGICFALMFALVLPTRILFVRVEGNQSVPVNQILDAAEACGICFGASRREVRSEKVKNSLLSYVPQLQWAGVNTSGCVASICVRERIVTEPQEEDDMVANIVASRDGYILSGTVTRGNGLFSEGQTVKAGQTLISAYTDCGICIRATKAQGEIIAQTNRRFKVVMPAAMAIRGEQKDIKQKYSLIFRKKRINLWKDSGISDTSCGRMYEEYYITLPGGFQLPVALCVERYSFYETQQSEVDQQSAQMALNAFAEQYLSQQMIAGHILHKAQTISLENGVYCLQGAYVCAEMIGRVQREQIGDTNGKSS